MNTETQTEAQRLISLAYLRISKGLLYGSDMSSSKVICYEDAINLLEKSIVEIKQRITVWQPGALNVAR